MRKTLSVLLLVGASAQFTASGSTSTSFAPAPAPATVSSGLSVKGLPIGTSAGIQDSDVACANGVSAACGLPNIASIYNPNPSMRYQTQASDQAITSIVSTGQYTPTGQRIAGNNPVAALNTVQIPYWSSGGAINSGGVITTGAQNPFRTPLTNQVNYVTSNPAAPNAFTPSASNAYLPTSAAFGLANAAPYLTTSPNTLTSAGFGYSTAIGQGNGATNAYLYGQGLGSSFGTLGSVNSFPSTGYSPYSYPTSSSFPSNSYSFPTSSFGSFPSSSYSFPSSSISSFPSSSYSPYTSSFPSTFSSSFPSTLSSYPSLNSYSSSFPSTFSSYPATSFGSTLSSYPSLNSYSTAGANFGFQPTPSFQFANAGLAGTQLSTQPAFTNAYTPSVYSPGPATGVAPQFAQTSP